MDGTPLEDHNEGKNHFYVASGKLGRSRGGRVRAEELSPAKRKEIALSAAQKR